MNIQSKDGDYSHLKLGGQQLSRWWLPWISFKSFWYNGAPTSDVSAPGRGVELRAGELRAKGRKKKEGGEGRGGSLLLIH